jgi:hypothetical protein
MYHGRTAQTALVGDPVERGEITIGQNFVRVQMPKPAADFGSGRGAFQRGTRTGQGGFRRLSQLNFVRQRRVGLFECPRTRLHLIQHGIDGAYHNANLVRLIGLAREGSNRAGSRLPGRHSPSLSGDA